VSSARLLPAGFVAPMLATLAREVQSAAIGPIPGAVMKRRTWGGRKLFSAVSLFSMLFIARHAVLLLEI
jgi:hypothetical protein